MTDTDIHNGMMAADAWYWATQSNIKLQGGFTYSTHKHEYQIDFMQSDHPRQCVKKAAQLGFSECLILGKTIHPMIYGKFPRGVMYLFPNRVDVEIFSKTRFKPLIESNPIIASHLKTDSTELKQLDDSMLYLLGARPSASPIEGSKKSSTNLKSKAVDALRFDEYDEMDPEMIDLALHRLDHSAYQHEFGIGDIIYNGTPTVPDFGIDLEYAKSDQRVLMLKCRHCNEYTCAEMEFPEYIRKRDDGTGYKCCKRCGKEIFTRDYEWIAQRPSVKNYQGWWVSQLNSAYIDPAFILSEFENPRGGNIGEVKNSRLGMAHVDAENRLTKNEVLSCCTDDLMATMHDGPCAMGVDVGNTLHYVIGCRIGSRNKIVKVGRLTSFSELADLERKYNVKCTVIDANPDTHAARSHQKTSKSSVYLCTYVESQAGDIKWIDDERRVTVNRNEILDRTHNRVVDKGRLEIPRMCSEIDTYAEQMTMIIKAYEKDKLTGATKTRYRKVGGPGADDHYRHATGYFEMACERIGEYHPNSRQGGFGNRHDLSYAVK